MQTNKDNSWGDNAVVFFSLTCPGVVGAKVGLSVGEGAVGTDTGFLVGWAVGVDEGTAVGFDVGCSVGVLEGN